MKTLKQLLEEEINDENDEWIVKDLIKKGTINLLAGEPSCGKTLFALQLIKAITNGNKFLGRDTKKVKILYISSEASYSNLRKRLKEAEFEPNENITFNCDFNISLMQLGFQASGYDFVIIDVLADLFKEAKDNHNYWDVTEVFSRIRQNKTFENCTFLLLHHLNKSKKVMGSQGFDSCPDTRMILTAPNGKEEPFRELEIYGKGVPFQRQALRFNYPNLEVTDEVAEKESMTNKILALTIAYVHEHKSIKGPSSEVIKKMNLIKEGCYPSQYSTFLNLNKQTLYTNGIGFEKDRTHSGRYIELKLIENGDSVSSDSNTCIKEEE